MTDYRKPDAYGPPQFPETDIVERLRKCKGRAGQSLTLEAADKIEVQRSQIKWQDDEIERLRADNAILMGNTNAAIEDYNDALKENAKLREALEKALKQSEIGAWTAARETIRAALQKEGE